MSTETLLNDVDGDISPVNRAIAIVLIDLLREKGLLEEEPLVGSDGQEGISIRWPVARLFCDVTDALIYISVVPPQPASYRDIHFDIYDYSRYKEAVEKIASIVKRK